ncbi:hypothetical protein ACWCQZ_49585 [Streptomyces sp. NPDC002285]
MAPNSPPDAWFWAHDIRHDQIDSVMMPGTRLVRLSRYGTGRARRFAALVFKEPGRPQTYLLGLDAAALETHMRETGARPVAVTVDAATEDAPQPRLSVILDNAPGPPPTIHVGLEETEVRTLLDGCHRIVDLATYSIAGIPRYVVILEERRERSWLLTAATTRELSSELHRLDASPVLLREHAQGVRRKYVAIAERSPATTRSVWRAGLDADGVAKHLARENAYPIDLAATRDIRGVHFTVVMRRRADR